MTKKKWIIRKANLADSEDLKKCMEMAYSAYVSRLNGERLPPMEADYELEIAIYPVWVAQYDKEVVGGLILMFEDDYAKIANVAVSPKFQGKGLGKDLMSFAEAEARRRGYSEINLTTHVSLHENISYYLKLGWTEINRDNVHVHMKKNISEI